MPLTYSLAPPAVADRARALSMWGAAAVAAPAWVVVALVAQLGLATGLVTTGLAALIGAIAAARALLEYGRMKRRLAALAVEADDAGLVVRSMRGETRVPRAAVARVAVIEGPLGGLRMELDADDLPRRVDVPRGGDGFGELVALVGAWTPVERTRKRGRIARVTLGAVVVLGLFFVPFLVSDVRGSRVGVALVLVAAWGAMRFVTSRA